jgi:hypothetical protein
MTFCINYIHTLLLLLKWILLLIYIIRNDFIVFNVTICRNLSISIAVFDQSAVDSWIFFITLKKWVSLPELLFVIKLIEHCIFWQVFYLPSSFWWSPRRILFEIYFASMLLLVFVKIFFVKSCFSFVIKWLLIKNSTFTFLCSPVLPRFLLPNIFIWSNIGLLYALSLGSDIFKFCLFWLLRFFYKKWEIW